MIEELHISGLGVIDDAVLEPVAKGAAGEARIFFVADAEGHERGVFEVEREA